MPTDPFYFGLVIGVVFSVIVAVAGGVLTRMSPWYYALKQPSWKPPDWAFGPIWTVILGFVALAIAYAWAQSDSTQRPALIWALLINGVLNIAWSGIFFVMKRPKLALAELAVFWLSIVFLIFVLGGVSATAGWLLLPYLLWVTTAGLLNLHIVRLNP